MSKTSTQRISPTPGKSQRRGRGSVQQHFVRIRHIYDHMLCLSTGSGTSYDFINVLVVEGISYDLKSVEEQMLLNEQFQALLAGMGQDVQILWRVSPLNLGDYLRQFEVTDEAASAGIWRLLSSSHADFLQALGQRRTLLKREIYVVLRTNSFGKAMSQAQRLLRTRSQQRMRWSQQVAQARQDLDLQAGEMMRLLADMNLSVRRLRGVEELTTFYYRYLRPTHAQQFPLPADVIQTIDHPILAPRSPQAEVSPATQKALVLLEQSNPASAAERVLVDLPLSFTQLADLVAPAAMTVGPDYLTVEKEFARVLVIQNMPRSVFPGWLKPLADLDEPMEISFHLHPHRSDAVMPQLRRQYRAYQSSVLLASQKGNDVDPDTQIADDDVGGLLLRLASGAERLLTVSISILLRAPSKRLLNERTARLQAVLHSMLLVAREALFEQDKAFRTCLPHGRCEMPGILLDSRSASTLFPFLSNSLFHEHGILEGITPQGDPVIFDAWGEGMANANRIILGPPGWGKSHSIKSMLIRLALKYHCQQVRTPEKGLPFQAILIDHEREYTTISTSLEGQTIRLSPGSAQHLNPFDLPQRKKEDHLTDHEDRLADHVAKLHTLLEIMLANRTPDGGGTLDSSEHGLLDRALYEAYRKVGISKDPQTHNRPAPLLRDLYEVLEKGDCGPDPTGLKLRLRRYVKGSLAGLFDGPTNVSLDQMIVTFDLYDLSTELRPIGLFLVSNFVWTQSFQSLIPRQLIVDEAATLMDYKSGAIFLEDLVRRARKYYLGVTVISQHPRIFQESAIPANCATHVLMRQDVTSLDLIGDMFKLSTREVQLLRRLPVGEALLLTSEKRLHVRFEASEVEHLLATTDRREITSWSQQHVGSVSYGLLRDLNLLQEESRPEPRITAPSTQEGAGMMPGEDAEEAPFSCPQLPFPASQDSFALSYPIVE